ncbi:MAG: hypothetical protein RL722_2224 [Pseudomonadota bacterium]|jgi:YjbE family integral membrane protein
MDPSTFLAALATIIFIDLVLAGDNAIVIALAARRLPPAQQRRAILWGTAGAIAVRSAMTVIVVWLLALPGLLAVGGALLVWIAWKLLLPDAGGHHEDGPAATSFWVAMRTIVVADALMGLDNVLAVAGAAHGSYLLVVLGLLVSVPVVVWGSTLVLRWVERWPAIVYLGSAVLCATAAKMILAEPVLKPLWAAVPQAALLPWLSLPVVLWLGFQRNHRQLQSRIHAHLGELAARRPRGRWMVGMDAEPAFGSDAGPAGRPASDPGIPSTASVSPAAIPAPSPSTQPGDNPMLKVLVPVDGAGNALVAVRHVIDEYRRHHPLELHLLNVQPRLSRHVARWINRRNREDFYAEQAGQSLATASALLDSSGIPYATHWRVGERATEICRSAAELGVHHIVMGTARKNSLTRMLEDSTTAAVLDRTPVPVEVIAGPSVSRLERWGLPASLGLGLTGLVWMAMD